MEKGPNLTKITTAQTSIEEYLDALAGGESTPGGGAAAALTGSQAAALLSMVLNFTVGRKRYAEFEEEMEGYLQRTELLRAELLALADRDAEAFGAVAACYAMPRLTDAEKSKRTLAMQTALRGAAEVPLAMAALCLEIMELTPPIAEKGNSNVVSDAATAAHLAFAAMHSALVNVRINLKFMKDEAYVDQGQARVESLVAAAESSYNAARAACKRTLGIAI